MKRIFAAIVIASSLTSCATTGDPSEGGLFGWSQSMSNQRIADRRAMNSSIQADTQDKWAEARRLNNQLSR